MDFFPAHEIGRSLVQLVRRTAESLSGGFPTYPIRVEVELQPRSDGDYLYVKVEVASMLGDGCKPRELRIATPALPEDHRGLLAGGLQQARGPEGESRPVQPTTTDHLRERIREALVRFIYRGHNVAYVDSDAVDSYRAYLTAEEALDAATPFPNGTRRASGSRRGSEASYEAVRSGSDDASIRQKHSNGSYSLVQPDDDLLGVEWEPEQFTRIDRLG